jgi:hypothetical protein
VEDCYSYMIGLLTVRAYRHYIVDTEVTTDLTINSRTNLIILDPNYCLKAAIDP